MESERLKKPNNMFNYKITKMNIWATIFTKEKNPQYEKMENVEISTYSKMSWANKSFGTMKEKDPSQREWF